MRYAYADARHKFAQFTGNALQPGNAVMHVVNSAAAPQFTLQRFFNHAAVIFGNISFYRQAVLRRRFNYAHIAPVNKRQMQCTRNRCCRQAQYINACFPFFYFFFLRHAEALFFIYN